MIDMRTWPRDAASQPTSNTVRRAYDLVASSFGPGANAPPFTIGVDATQVSDDQLHQTIADLRSADDVVLVSEPPLFNADRTASVFTVEPATAPSDGATVDTLHRVRYAVPGGMYATGMTPYFADASERLAQRLWLVIIVVVGLAVALLTIAFRAPVVALKAAVMNLLAAAATFGGPGGGIPMGAGGVGLLGLPGGSADFELGTHPGLHHALRTVDGLRGVHPVPGARGMARDEGSAAERDPRPRLDSTCDHQRGLIMIAVFLGFAADGDITVKMMGVRDGRGGLHRRHHHPDDPGACHDGVARAVQLVATGTARLPPAGLLAETGTAERRTPERGLVDTSP